MKMQSALLLPFQTSLPTKVAAIQGTTTESDSPVSTWQIRRLKLTSAQLYSTTTQRNISSNFQAYVSTTIAPITVNNIILLDVCNDSLQTSALYKSFTLLTYLLTYLLLLTFKIHILLHYCEEVQVKESRQSSS